VPFLFSNANKGIGSMFMPYLFELPANILVVLLIDSAKWGGRKIVLNLGLISYIFTQFAMYYYRKSFLIVGMILLRATSKICISALQQLKLDSFTTILRTLGVGSTDCLGRIAAIFSSYIAFNLFYIDPYLPFLVFGLLSLITVICVAIHPIELT
jgi:hypothetical protein